MTLVVAEEDYNESFAYRGATMSGGLEGEFGADTRWNLFEWSADPGTAGSAVEFDVACGDAPNFNMENAASFQTVPVDGFGEDEEICVGAYFRYRARLMAAWQTSPTLTEVRIGNVEVELQESDTAVDTDVDTDDAVPEDTGEDDINPTTPGCGCASTGMNSGWLLIGLAGLLRRRR